MSALRHLNTSNYHKKGGRDLGRAGLGEERWAFPGDTNRGDCEEARSESGCKPESNSSELLRLLSFTELTAIAKVMC